MSFFYSATLLVCVNDCSNKLAISSYSFLFRNWAKFI